MREVVGVDMKSGGTLGINGKRVGFGQLLDLTQRCLCQRVNYLVSLLPSSRDPLLLTPGCIHPTM